MEDTKKVRRRIEDALRKGHWRDVYKVAALLHVGCEADHNGHAYAEHECPRCGAIFCWGCCGRTNRHEGGKYDPDFMTCPVCGYDVDA